MQPTKPHDIPVTKTGTGSNGGLKLGFRQGVFLLCILMAFPPVLLEGTGKAAPYSHALKAPSTLPAEAPPLLDALQNLPPIPWELGFGPEDPLVDEDPFFLGSQSWAVDSLVLAELSEHPSQAGLYGTTVDGRLALKLAGSQKTWWLNQPLDFVYATEDYLILKARDDAFFERVQGGQGVFLVGREDLQRAEEMAQSVPVFFLPLPEYGWTGSMDLVDHPELGRLTLIDRFGDILPVSYADIQTVVKAERLNWLLATGAGLQAAMTHPELGYRALRPPRGSTAGFGVLFTGFNREFPDTHVFEFKRGPLSAFWRKFKQELGSFGVAYASETLEESNAKLVSQLTRVSTVMALSLVAAVVLRLTLFKEHYRKKHAEEPARGVFKSGVSHGKDVLDIWAHNLTVINQFPNIWFANVVEFSLDRYLPRLGGGRNTLTKKLLDQTVYFVRSTSERVPVNYWTLIQGAIVLGGIDSFNVYAQLYWFNPPFAKWLATQFPEFKDRLESTFNPENELFGFFNRNESVRNLANWFVSGASKFSHDVRSQYTNVLGPEIDLELEKEGIDPHDPRNKAERTARLEKRLSEVQRQMGLPGAEDFLFDAATLWQQTMRLLGYRSPDESEADLLGNQNPGFLLPAIKAALKEGKKRLKAHPDDPALLSAVDILTKTQSDVSYLRGYVRYPWRYIREKLSGRGPPHVLEVFESLKAARQALIALTYEGPLSTDLRSIPTAWLDVAGKPGASVASELFRKSFYSLVEGMPQLLKGPDNAHDPRVLGHYGELEKSALEVLRSRYEEDFKALMEKTGDEDQAYTSLRSSHLGEFSLLFDERLTFFSELQKEMAKPYKPPFGGWYKKWQTRRILKRAKEAYQQQYGGPFVAEALGDAERAQWNRTVSDAYLHEEGIYPDYDAANGLLENVERKSTRILHAQLQNPKLGEYLKSLDDVKREEFLALLYAQNSADAYIEFTHDSQAVPALSTAQPGRFQWLRQTRWVKKSSLLTRLVRAVESSIPVEAHRLGLLWAVGRNTPFVGYDAALGVLRTMRNFITWGTATYWFNYWVWGVWLPLPIWLVATLTMVTVYAPSQILNRFCRMQGWEPMGSVKKMAFFALIYAWLTCWGTFPDLMYERDVAEFLDSTKEFLHSNTVQLVQKSSEALGECALWLSKNLHME